MSFLKKAKNIIIGYAGSVLLFFILFHAVTTEATSYLTYVSDLLSTSAPEAYTDQTIRFRLARDIPPNGAIEIDFDGGGFTIPATLNYTDVDLAFSAIPGGPYTDRPLSSVQSAGTDDVTVTSGAAGKVRFDLNTTVGIAADSEVVVEIGTVATYGAVGDVRTQLAMATGTYPVTIRTFDASDVEVDYGKTLVVVVEQVNAGPVDTTDQIPPVILLAEPTGILQVGTRGVELYVVTDEQASCRYATSSMAYSLMPYSFYGTSTTNLSFWHFAQVTGLEDATDYIFYLRCVDFRLNEINPDYELAFTVGILPGTSTTTSTTTTSTGTGTGSASTTIMTGPGTGDDIGTGGGPTGSGSGSSPTGGDSSGSGSGGSSGGGDYLPLADVRIDGFAYPSGLVSIIKDGVVVGTKAAGSGGEFSYLIEGLDRGSYSFAVYAVDADNVRGSTYNTTLWLQSDTLNVLSNVMLAPTIHVAEASISPGDSLAVSGYTVPNATVTTWLRPRLAEVSTSDIVTTAVASSNGAWSVIIPTSGLAEGTYELVAQGKTQDGLIESDKSVRKTIGIGVSVPDGDCKSIGDLNCDGFVNLVDFSILLFNWNTASIVADINDDGIVSLPDFSIMLFYWTG